MFREISAICAVVMLAALPAAANPTVRINLGPGGQEANGYSPASDISANGRWVAFSSHATNLVAGLTALDEDVYLRDLQTQRTELVSFGPGGGPIDFGASDPAISGDGRFVAFDSNSTNLVPGDTNENDDVFVFDRKTGRTERVSVASDGAQADSSNLFPRISGDGRFVLFTSYADNLVPGDTNGTYDVFVHDRATHTTARVSVDSHGRQADGPSQDNIAIAHDGSFVMFSSGADNLVPNDRNDNWDVFLHRGPPLAGH